MKSVACISKKKIMTKYTNDILVLADLWRVYHEKK